MFSRREFLMATAALSAIAGPGLVGRWSQAAAQQSLTEDGLLDFDAFGNVTLEAMACGLPVVAAAATGSQSLVSDGVSGRLIRPGAIREFAQALRAYAQSDELRRAHGQAGEARSLDFDWDRINQSVADTYLRLIRQKRAAR